MPSIKRLAGVGISALVLLAGGAVTAPSASATVGDKTCGVPMSGGGTLNIPLCLTEVSNGYKISYYNNTGQTQHLDFNLNCSSGRYGDEGSFTSYPGWTSYYTFTVGIKSWCQGGMYDYGSSMWYWTKSLNG
jgi:hypothetical protein